MLMERLEIMSSAILIADKPSEHIETYRRFLARKGHRVFTAVTLDDAAILLDKTPCSVAIIGSALVDDPDSLLLQAMKKNSRGCKFVLLTPFFDAEVFLNVLHGSIFHECLVSPLELSLLGDVIHHLIYLDEEARGKIYEFTSGLDIVQ